MRPSRRTCIQFSALASSAVLPNPFSILPPLNTLVWPSKSNNDSDRSRIVVRKMPVRPVACHSGDFFILHLLIGLSDGGIFRPCHGIIDDLLQLQEVVSGCFHLNRLLLCPPPLS